MNQRILQGCLAVAMTFGLQSVALADDTISTTTTKTEGPPVVIDSYMKPTVVQTKETVDAAGNTQKSVAPIIQERHERVVLPESQTTTTVTEHTGSTAVVKSVAKAKSCTVKAAPKRKVAHRIRHHRTYVSHKPKSVAVAQKVVVEKKVVEPTIIQRQDSTIEKSTIIERRDPALDLQ